MNAQQYEALKAEILADPDCAPLAVTNDAPKVEGSVVAAKDREIARILTSKRAPAVKSKEVGDGAVALALGIQAGPVFLLKLEALANMAFNESTPAEQLAQIALARQAWRSLLSKSFDVGLASVRAGLDLFVGTLLNAEGAAAIKALAETPNTVTAEEVSRALRGPWE